MVSPDGRVRVMDLGLARGTGEEAAEAGAGAAGSALSIEMTQAGAILGTPGYMAPEQFRGGETDTRTDVFAFCVTLWEAVYGERPFAGETWEALMANVAAGTRRPPPRSRPAPRWLRRCCERGLAVRPELRWPSMTALLDALTAGQAQARRRRWAAAAGLVAFTGAAFVDAGRYAEAQTAAACAAAGASVAEVWNAEAQAGLMAGKRALRIEESARTSEDWLADLRFTLAEALWDAPAGGGRDRVQARVLAAQARERRRIVEVEPGALAEVEAFLARRPR